MKQITLNLRWLIMSLLLCVGVGAGATDVTIDLSKQGYINAEKVSSVTSGDVTLTFTDGGTATAYFETGNAVRVYKDGSMTVSAGGATITQVVFTYELNGKATVTVSPDGYDTKTKTWTGSATSIVLKAGTEKHVRISKVVVTYEDSKTDVGSFDFSSLTTALDKDATPTFDPAGFFTPADGLTGDVVFTVTPGEDDSEIAYYVEGEIWALAEGEQTFTVTATPATADSDGFKAVSGNFTITVTDPNPSIAFANAAQTINAGETYTQTATKKNADEAIVSYTSSNTAVATVNATTGEVTGVAKGTATITASITVNETVYTATYTVTVRGEQIEYDFSEISNLSTWSSYSKHDVDYTDATVSFASAMNQTMTITDIPVTKGGDVELILKPGKLLQSVSFVCRKWGTKAQTITLHYSTDGGENYISTGVTSTNFTIAKDNLPLGTNAVKVTFSSSANQVGIESATIELRKSVDVDITTAGYSTLYWSDIAFVVPTGITAKTYTVDVAGKLTVSKTYEADDVLPAGEAVVLEGAAGAYSFEVTTTDEEKDDASMLRGSDTDATTTADGDAYFYMLSLNAASEAGSAGFYWGAEGGAAFTCKAHKAYLVGPKTAQAKSFFRFDETTAIEGIAADARQASTSGIFNLSGQRLSHLQKGLNIVNGKKVFIK